MPRELADGLENAVYLGSRTQEGILPKDLTRWELHEICRVESWLRNKDRQINLEVVAIENGRLLAYYSSGSSIIEINVHKFSEEAKKCQDSHPEKYVDIFRPYGVFGLLRLFLANPRGALDEYMKDKENYKALKLLLQDYRDENAIDAKNNVGK